MRGCVFVSLSWLVWYPGIMVGIDGIYRFRQPLHHMIDGDPNVNFHGPFADPIGLEVQDRSSRLLRGYFCVLGPTERACLKKMEGGSFERSCRKWRAGLFAWILLDFAEC
mmetsp:Transcript_2711/g.5794  ORF Transcript_2711/g.5794 Transcript_2711/m.5794 type:complete len:110 (-) Transcript_2711:4156-4485(-)